jgi:hypothetical protein
MSYSGLKKLAIFVAFGGALAATASAQCNQPSEGLRAQCCHNRCYSTPYYEQCFNKCMGRAILQELAPEKKKGSADLAALRTDAAATAQAMRAAAADTHISAAVAQTSCNVGPVAAPAHLPALAAR